MHRTHILLGWCQAVRAESSAQSSGHQGDWEGTSSMSIMITREGVRRMTGTKQGQEEKAEMMHRRFHLDMRKDFPVQWASTGTGCPGRWRFSFTGDIPELSGHNPVLCALEWSTWPTVVPSKLTHSGILWSPLLYCWQCHEKSLLEQKTKVRCSLYIKLNIRTNCNMLGDKA